jgi:hypothetical protein
VSDALERRGERLPVPEGERALLVGRRLDPDDASLHLDRPEIDRARGRHRDRRVRAEVLDARRGGA